MSEQLRGSVNCAPDDKKKTLTVEEQAAVNLWRDVEELKRRVEILENYVKLLGVPIEAQPLIGTK